eukprot:CAMPEP_0185333644 /NCGR_PEP_ID=MMETSP1363-20130426/83779_1 /TAXON_ID=38817 /ORGANISM="Gephyrocapsa oceanica, Strain RCC1303" /LENGTH=67 /DNA_ID=CAMNT_0027932591 /DNA_START=136 /DNA_END=335 /DNA_ORIENTATION=+
MPLSSAPSQRRRHTARIALSPPRQPRGSGSVSTDRISCRCIPPTDSSSDGATSSTRDPALRGDARPA